MRPPAFGPVTKAVHQAVVRAAAPRLPCGSQATSRCVASHVALPGGVNVNRTAAVSRAPATCRPQPTAQTIQTFGRIAPVHTGDAAGGAATVGGQPPSPTISPNAGGQDGAPAGGAPSPTYTSINIYRLVKWAASDRATRELIIADGIDHGVRGLGKLCTL
eukprot:2652573-Prymnesium_polylepis.1